MSQTELKPVNNRSGDRSKAQQRKLPSDSASNCQNSANPGSELHFVYVPYAQFPDCG